MHAARIGRKAWRHGSREALALSYEHRKAAEESTELTNLGGDGQIEELDDVKYHSSEGNHQFGGLFERNDRPRHPTSNRY